MTDQQQFTSNGTVQNPAFVPTNVSAPSIGATASPIPLYTVLTCNPGTWLNASNYQYVWTVASPFTSGPLSFGPSYTVSSGDTGCTLICTVTATNLFGPSTPVASAASSVVAGSTIGPMSSSGFTTPNNYTTLTDGWNFSGSGMPHLWSLVIDDFNSYIQGSIEYTAPQVTFSSGGCNLGVATDSGSFAYQAGLVTTRGKAQYEYGRFRFTVQMPTCANPTGLWPACWLLTDPAGGAGSVEIDVVEMNMQFPTVVNGTLHGAFGAQIQTGTGSVSNAGTSMNVYEVIWQPGLITWGINGVAYEQYTGSVADGALCYLIVDNAVAYPSGVFGSAWNPSFNSELPVQMVLQSVQIYG